MNLPFNLSWQTAQTRWASILNPVLSLPPNNGILLKNIQITTGVNVINHKLGQTPQGWIVTDQDASCTFYRSAPFNDLTLSLTASANTTISLWVF